MNIRSQIETQELLIRLMKRREQGFAGKLIPIAWGILRDHDSAEEVVSTVTEKALKLYQQGRLEPSYPEGNFFGLLCVMTKRTAISERRRRRRHYVGRNNQPSEVFIRIDGSLQGLKALERKDDVERFMAAFATLPAIDRQILTLRHVDGMYLKDIGVKVGRCSKAVSHRISNATAQLHEMLPELVSKKGKKVC